MKKYLLIALAAVFSVNCHGQDKGTKITKENDTQITEQPKGTWKVDKEYDEYGNLIRYDSIYSWSSHEKFDYPSTLDKDSLIESFKSRFFSNYSRFENHGFEDIFAQDSLFSQRFFNDDFFGSDFGKDFMDIDKITQDMIARQKKFLKKYKSEFIRPEVDIEEKNI